LITGSGKKELVIRDNEADDGAWTDPDFLTKKIYNNSFVLEYKVWHPQEVLNALAAGAKITPVMSIDTGILNLTDEEKDSGLYVPTKFLTLNLYGRICPIICLKNPYILFMIIIWKFMLYRD
jgi:hypothetical protein